MMRFSVTIPTYKSAFLSECIDSVLSQTYKHFELIIVDDCSPEDIKSIVDSYSDIRIRYYRNEKNFGAENVVRNWNKCLEYATGDYLICMGDDDKLKPNCLSDYAELIDKFPDKDIFYSRTELIDENSNIITLLEERAECESVYEMIWHRWNDRRMFVGDYLYKVETLRRNGGFFHLPYAWGSDAISAYIAASICGIANTKRAGFQYRVNHLSISSDYKNIDGKIEALKMERVWFEKFFEKLPENEHDMELLVKLKRNIGVHFQKMYADDIVYGISKAPIQQSLYWFIHSKEFKLSFLFIMKCILMGLYYSYKTDK